MAVRAGDPSDRAGVESAVPMHGWVIPLLLLLAGGCTPRAAARISPFQGPGEGSFSSVQLEAVSTLRVGEAVQAVAVPEEGTDERTARTGRAATARHERTHRGTPRTLCRDLRHGSLSA